MVMDPARLAVAAASLEAGPVELTLHDSGGVDFVVAQAAKGQGIVASDARAKLIDDLNRNAGLQPQSPEFQRLVNAVGRFLAVSGSTLTLRLTPKGRGNLVQMLEQAKVDPIGALSRFTVEASLAAP
jgi:hypothetical protein